MKQQDIISDLKLRYGWGKSGNQEINEQRDLWVIRIYLWRGPHLGFRQRQRCTILTAAGTGQLPSGFTRIQQRKRFAEMGKNRRNRTSGWTFGLFGNKPHWFRGLFHQEDFRYTPSVRATSPYRAKAEITGSTAPLWRTKGLEVLLSYSGNISKGLSFSVTGNFSTYQQQSHLPAHPGARPPTPVTEQTKPSWPIHQFVFRIYRRRAVHLAKRPGRIARANR